MRMQKMLAFILMIGLMFQTAFGLIGEKYDVYENLRYGEAERDLVTVYVPKSAYDRESNGCILFIHGGSWNGGEKEDILGITALAVGGLYKYTISLSSKPTSLQVAYQKWTQSGSTTKVDGPVTSYVSSETFGVYALDANNRIVCFGCRLNSRAKLDPTADPVSTIGASKPTEPPNPTVTEAATMEE